MKAIIFDKTLQLVNLPRPKPQEGEALIQVLMAGICNTDLEILCGYMGFKGILGHEFIGKVVESTNPEWIGKRVVGEINEGCGNCDFCRSGLERHCPNRKVLGIQGKPGAFAEYMTLAEKNLHVITQDITDEEAVFIEPLAASLEILEQINLNPDYKIAIIGDGKLALLITQVLSLHGNDVTVVGKHDYKLKIAQEFGAHAFLTKQFNNGKFDVVVEASGSPDAFQFALGLVQPRGYFILKSTYHNKLKINPSEIVIHEITLIGSRCGVFKPAIRLLKDQRIRIKPLISSIKPLTEAHEAFKLAQEPESLKVIIDFRSI